MATNFTYLPYKETGYFSKLVTDYLCSDPKIEQFYGTPPNKEGMDASIKNRKNYPINRANLVATLKKQYSGLNTSEKVQANLQLLLSENTYTICTAHQPNLMTGYLYFIYKILHAIKLAGELGALYPGCNFVPVYYMGSEDNDLEELGKFNYEGQKYVWGANGQHGAVGRMKPEGLDILLNGLFEVLGPPSPKLDRIKHIVATAYLGHKTIGSATQYLVNELFGVYGLLVLDPDDQSFKREFIGVTEDELINQNAYPVLNAQIEKLSGHYKIQAQPRHINLFYLSEQLRERIEKQGDKWVVVNTGIEWDKEALLKELHENPGRFSPNVMLRGLYQETILPNVAFIGGGAEVAYWLQLKTLFANYNVFYPTILLRQSVQWIGESANQLMGKLGLEISDLFLGEQDLAKKLLLKAGLVNWHLEMESATIASVLETLGKKAAAIDPTLLPATNAVKARIEKMLHSLEQKMLRAEKRKIGDQTKRTEKLKSSLFPNNGLQERVENFLGYYLSYGPAFFDVLLTGMEPFRNEFLVVEQI